MKIDILGEPWQYYFKKKVSYDGQEVAGLCDPSKKKFYISLNYSTEEFSEKEIIRQISQTFYHEWFHALCYEAGFRDLSFWTVDVEHTLTAPLEKALAKMHPVQVEFLEDK